VLKIKREIFTPHKQTVKYCSVKKAYTVKATEHTAILLISETGYTLWMCAEMVI
jgi:hypothetical protein